MDRNDRNNSDNARQRQGQQSFYKTPQRPPSPDYRRQQRDNSAYDRSGERPYQSEGSSRMNARPGLSTRTPERRYELPDRPQQRMDSREAVLNEGQRNSSRFETRGGAYPAQDRQNRQTDGRMPRQNTGKEDWQREPGNYTRRNDGQREPRRYDPRDPRSGNDRQPTSEMPRDSRRFERNAGGDRPERPRDARRFEARDSARQSGQNDRRERMGSVARNTHDDDYYNAPRATDPRKRSDKPNRYDGMNEGSVDLGGFDINYKGDSDSQHGSPSLAIAPGILTKPMIIAIFAVAAVIITVIIFSVVSGGKKNNPTGVSGGNKKYEYNIPDSITIGGTKINTDSDYIELAEMNITDISDLSYCYLVSSLFINGNSIDDLTPIGDCISLKTLDANSNRISDIAPLSHLNQISDLDISGNQITDLSPLAKLNQLERLSAGKNQISDISALSGCSSLRQLIISDNTVSDLTPIAGMNNLTTLEAANNQITDILALSGLTNLSTLNLSGNKISDIKAVKTLSSLTILDLSDTAVSDVSSLSSLKGLLELNLTGTNVSKENLDKLKKDLPGCQIRK